MPGATNSAYGIVWPLNSNPVDQLPDADADREQVEDRLEEAADEDPPRAAVGDVVALEEHAGGLADAELGTHLAADGLVQDAHAPTSRLVSRRTVSHQPRAASTDEVDDVDERERQVDVAEDEHPGEVDAVPQRGQPWPATPSTGSRLLIGKNAPENRNSGIMPSRKTSANTLSSFIAAVSAIDRASRRPARSAAARRTRRPRPDHEVNTPNGAITSEEDRADRGRPGTARTRAWA